uniref:Sec23/Sec24 trunk domain-containing protein n=1 Tax=Ascaris lumbricoides TaxID=6252 RepID=A0A9J2PJM2_ASCLU
MMSFFLKKFSNAEELGYWTTQSPNIATTINKDSFDRKITIWYDGRNKRALEQSRYVNAYGTRSISLWLREELMAAAPPFTGFPQVPTTAAHQLPQQGYALKQNQSAPPNSVQHFANSNDNAAVIPPIPQVNAASFPGPPSQGALINNGRLSNAIYPPPVGFPPSSTQQIHRTAVFSTATSAPMHPFQQAPPVNYSAAAHSFPRSSSQGGTPTGAVFSSTNGRVTTPSMPYPTTQYPSYNVGNTMTGMPKVDPVIHSATGAMRQGIPPQYPLQQNARASPSLYESPPKMNGPMGGTQPQPPTTPYSNQLLNGSYPGTMANMSHQFAQMGVSDGQQTSRIIDLMQERSLLKLDNDDVEVELPSSVCNPDTHCSPSVFRCTFRAIPQTQELLKKSRLPFGLTLQPFRNMKHLNVISASTIVRCRYCRTYINPYIYLPDSRHWKCNLCYRINDLPDDFSWDPSLKVFAEPSRRPEIRNATVEFIAPSEYMLRSPQPAVYVFVLDVSQAAIESGYLYTFSEQLLIALESLPGDDRTLIAFLGVDAAIHFFQFSGKSPPRQLIVDDYDDPFLPVNSGLLVNLRKNIDEEIGGRITVLQTVLPNLGPGALISREDPNQRASTDVQNLGPATDFYKSFALECTGHQVAIDLFLLNTQYADLATLSEVAKFSSGCVLHYSGYHITRNEVQVKRFQKQLRLTLHTFYGNFFVRSTDLLAMANVNPDSAFGVQVQMEENLTGLNSVCFQAALLYTSSKGQLQHFLRLWLVNGDRRIRVHTLCLPVTKDLSTVYSQFDVKCAVSLLSKMGGRKWLLHFAVAMCFLNLESAS